MNLSYSIIIPAYNAEKTIIRTLKSCILQNPKPKEIIVVDDGSKDKTAEKVSAFAKAHKKQKIILLSQKNQGPAKARNLGAEKSKAEILIFTDSDCVLSPSFAKEILKPFKDKNVAGVQGAYKTKQKELVAQFVQLEIEERYKKMLSSKNLDWIGSYAAAYRKKAFDSVHGFDTSFPKASGEDPELSYSLQKKGKKLVFAPKAFVYHQHPSSLFSYLKVKFYRAYYRILLYKKHPDKIINDSYTIQRIKLQILTIPFILLGIFPFFRTTSSFFLFCHLFLTLPFFSFSFKKNPKVAFASFFLELARSTAFFFGLLKGYFDKRWRNAKRK